MRYKLIATITLLISSLTVCLGQGEGSDFFRSIGKMYVVVAVVAATFIGIVIFLIYIDRKITRIENEISSHK
jgi:CcmD family protein